MRRGIMGGIVVMCCVATGRAAEAEAGLVAHYTFDEGQGTVLKDHSGHGHDGTIEGAAWVKSPRGQALSFNGKDSRVVISTKGDLNLEGDATFEAWVKTASNPSARDCLIFGDDASLTVNRNLSIVIDKGDLWVYQGNDVRSANYVLKHKFDDTWTHLAVVFEQPRYFIYLNGVLAQTGPLDMPLSKTKGGNRCIGGWWAGHFKGEIDEVRLYNRPLPEREILRHADITTPATPAIRVAASLSYMRSRVTLDALCRNVPQQAASVEFVVAAEGQETPVASQSAKLTPTRPESERAAAQAEFVVSDLRPGPYEGRVVLKDTVGKEIAVGKASFAWPQRPAWLGSKKGFGDDVLPPFTPVAVRKDGAATGVSLWGRAYRFADGPFLSQVTSKSADMLAGPMRLVAKAGGKEVAWKAGPIDVTEEKPHAVSLAQSLSGQDLSATFATQVEYDGYVTVNWTLRPGAATEISELSLEIPFKADHALYLYTWPTGSGGYSGSIKQEHAGAFRPMIWIGDNERGMSWFCESQQNWAPADPNQAYEIIRQSDSVTLKLHLIGPSSNRKSKIENRKPLSYTFSFQATPLRPMERDGWDYAFVRVPWYGRDYEVLTQQIEGKPAMKYLQEAGYKTLGLFNWTPVLSYPSPLAWADKLRAVVKSCHEHDMKVVIYLGFLFSERAPEYPAFTDDVTCIPRKPFPDKYPDQEMQMCDTVCLRGPWQDALVDNVARMMEEFDIDGIYLDTTTWPFECQNERHGCGYRDAEGRLQCVYPISSVRQTFRRFYTVIKAKKPEGVVDAHVWDCMNGAALSFATNYWNGEQLSKAAFLPDGLPLDRFRTEFMGVNWGVPADFLHYQLGDFVASHAISLLHDVIVRPALLEEIALESKIYKLADRFGRKQAEFLPYWSNTEYVKISPANCYASLYKHPTNGVLAIVSNLSKAEATVALELSPEKLGLPKEGLSATDGLTGKPVDVKGDKLTLSLPSVGWQYVWVKPR